MLPDFERGRRPPLLAVVGLFAALASALWSPPAPAQTIGSFNFNAEGPAPTFGPTQTTTTDGLQSRDAPPNGTISGAIQTILANPTNASNIIIGAPNGGIWTTQDGGKTWNTTTDTSQPSLSIASMAYNSTNSEIVFAGVGSTDNGHTAGGQTAGQKVGVMESTDGGVNWTTLATSVQGPLDGKSVVGVAGFTQNGVTTIFAATSEPNSVTTATGANGYGLYESVGNGAFALVNDGASIPKGAATSLVGQGTTGNPYYVAIYADDPTKSAIYRSTNGGQTWSKVQSIAQGMAGRLAIAPNGAVAVAIYNPLKNSTTNPTGGQITGLALSQSGDSGTWKTMTAPAVNGGNQANNNLTIAIDPNNTKIVYVAGDAINQTPFTVSAYRVTLNNDGSTSQQVLTDSGTINNSTVHSDSRAFAFDASGRLLLSSDGGIYALTSPSTGGGSWTSLNGNLSLREAYAVAYDPISKRLVVAAQDNGVVIQNTPGAPGSSPITGGDGIVATVNEQSLKAQGQSVIYTASQNLGSLTRSVVTAQGQTLFSTPLLGVGANAVDPVWNFVNQSTTVTDFTEPSTDSQNPNKKLLPFSSLFIANRVDSSKIAIGTNYVYVTTDDQIQAAPCSDGTCTANVLTNVGTTTSPGSVSALSYGAPGAGGADALLVGTSNGIFFSPNSAGGSLVQKTAYAGNSPTSLVFGLSSSIFYVADGTNLWGTTNGGGSFGTALTSNLSNSTNLNITSPASVEFITKNNANVLLVGGINNWDGTSGTVNSLSPIAAALSKSDGTLIGWAPFGRGLPNTYVNQIAYSPTADVLAVSLYGRGIWTVYDVTSYFSTSTLLSFGGANNDSTPTAAQLADGVDVNNTAFSRGLTKTGSGTLTINSTAAYTGATAVNGGTLTVNGSIANSSSLVVASLATLTGNGTVPATTINGTVAPGNPGGALSVNGAYVQSAGSTYTVGVTAAGLSDRINVTGSANLAGTVNLVAGAGGFAPRRTYTILNAIGGIAGGYSGATTGLPFLQGLLSYDSNNVRLSLMPGGFARGAQSSNQGAVGAVLDSSSATASGDFITVTNAMSLMGSSQAPVVFNQLSGQNYSGFATSAMQTAQLLMANFAQQAGGGGGGGRVALAQACEDTCDFTEPSRWGAWGGGLAGVGTVAGDSNSLGQNYSIEGFAGGVDYLLTRQFRLGVTGGYSSATLNTQGLDGRGVSNTFQFGLYGDLALGNLYVDALAGYANSGQSMLRSISIPGLAPRLAIGNTSTDQFFGQLETGYKLGLGGAAAQAFVTPFARLQASTATQPAFTESGADSVDLSVAAQTTQSLRSVFGAALGGKIGGVALQVRLGWSHDFADTSRPVTASFVGAPATPFSVAGAAAPRDGAVFGLGATTNIADSTGLYFRYDGDMAGGNTSHTFSAGVRTVF